MKRSVLKLLSRIFRVKVPLSIAIQHDRIEDLELAIDLKIDLNFHKMYNKSYIYPLLTAVYFEKYEISRLILDRGYADPNFRYSPSKNQYGVETPSKRGKSKKRNCWDGDRKKFKKQTKKNEAFCVFYDPLGKISNDIVPPKLSPSIDIHHFNKITPTVLSFVLGNFDLLDLCFKKGGRLNNHFDLGGDSTFMWYFLEHPNTCQSKICQLLVNYREFVINKKEQQSFSEFCEKFSIMKAKITLDIELAEDMEKIIQILQTYGFKKRESKRLRLQPRRVSSSSSLSQESIETTSSTFHNGVINNHHSGESSGEHSSESYCFTNEESTNGEYYYTDDVETDNDRIRTIYEDPQLQTRRRSISNPIHLDVTMLQQKRGRRSVTLDGYQFDHDLGRIIHQSSDGENNNYNNHHQERENYYISKRKGVWVHPRRRKTSLSSECESQSECSTTTPLMTPLTPVTPKSSKTEKTRRIFSIDEICTTSGDHNDVSSTSRDSSTTTTPKKQYNYHHLHHHQKNGTNSIERIIVNGTRTPYRFTRPKSFYKDKKINDLLKKDDGIIKASIRRRKLSHRFHKLRSNNSNSKTPPSSKKNERNNKRVIEGD